MSYVRANGRISGRVSGRWGDASINGRYQLGAIDDLGLGPKVTGDPILTLIAQLNRFAGKTTQPGNGCGARNYLPQGALPMTPEITDKAASTALLIMGDRYDCVGLDLFAYAKAMWVNNGLTNAVSFVTTNLAEVTTTIAQYGDKMGLPPATYGITERDEKFQPPFPTTAVVIGGGVLLVALAAMRRK